VLGSHTFADESVMPLTLSIRADVSDVGGSTLTALGKTAVTVSDAPLTDTSTAPSTQPTFSEGASTGTFTVATFTDANPGDHASDFTATIHWGDGTTTPGTVSFDRGTQSHAVLGSHTFADSSAMPLTLSIRADVSDVGGSTLTALGKTAVTVNDAALHDASTPNSVSVSLRTPQNGMTGTVEVAKFTDDNPGNHTPDFTVLINWGDRSGTDTTSEMVTYNSGTQSYTVTGSHTYTTTGVFNVLVTVTDQDGNILTSIGMTTITVNP
jgi:hypothetical protein